MEEKTTIDAIIEKVKEELAKLPEHNREQVGTFVLGAAMGMSMVGGRKEKEA